MKIWIRKKNKQKNINESQVKYEIAVAGAIFK